jgi:predicted nucleic acid-binding protein
MRGSADLIALPDPADWDLAKEIQLHDLLSFWDALLIATCMRHEVTTLYTEDMSSPRTIRGVRLLNPFLPPAP